MFDILIKYVEKIRTDLEGDLSLDNASVRISVIPQMLDQIQGSAPAELFTSFLKDLENYKTLFEACRDVTFLNGNLQNVYDSLINLIGCLSAVYDLINEHTVKCPCCGNTVTFIPSNNLCPKCG